MNEQCSVYSGCYFIFTFNGIDGYHVICDYHETDKTMIIENLESKIEFNDYLLKCGQSEAVIVIYSQCYVGDIVIPINQILDNYPKLRTLELRWKL